MTKIVEIVNFHTAYGEQVRLLDYFYNEDQNRAHMAGYVPIRSHRDSFLSLAQAQLPDKENKEKVFMLTGSFGTGKSHLCLMLGNYYSMKATDVEMQEFFSNWAKRDKTTAETIRNWRGGGRYLVAPCDFGEARPFEDMVISAVETALEYEGAHDVILNTHFKSALRQIEGWENRQKEGQPIGIFKDFLTFLGGDDPQLELEHLKTGLDENDSAAMELFQDTYQKATGQKLTFRTDNLLAILKDLLSSTQFKGRYKGLVILADEFGYALSENRVSMSVFHGLAEMSKDGVDGMQLIFVGTGHRRFAAYGANTQLQIDFRVVQDRVTEVSLESEELEQIIASLVSPMTDSPIWQQEVLGKNDWLLTNMAGAAKKLGVFDYLTEPELKEQIVTHIYPVHPLATYCLTKMSQELGSDARSVFSFFRKFGDTPPTGGYSWFVREHDVTRSKGELNIYTPEFLASYFEPSISTSNLTVRPEIRDHIRNYRAAVEEARRYAYKNKLTKEIDPFTQRVLDLMFVYRVSNFNVTQQTLENGLNLVQPTEKKTLTSELKGLISNKIVFRSPSGEYEFRRSDMADLDVLISAMHQEILDQSLDLSSQVGNLASRRWDVWTEAKGHNQDYLGDKRALRVWATTQELSATHKLPDGSDANYWDFLEHARLSQKSWKDRYDGIMVYVLCESDTDVKLAQQAVKSNTRENVIVGIPSSPIPIVDTVVALMAVTKFKETEQYSKLDFQEKALIDEMLGKEAQKTGRVGEFLLVRERYLDAKDLFWYREDGKTHLVDPTNEYEPADVLMNRLYRKRNTVSHEYLSKAHPRSFSGVRDTALREAVAKLVDTDRSVQIDHAEKENRGEIRYLKFALVNEGILQQEGDYDGNVASYELESNPAKYQLKYPALADLIDGLKAVKRGESENAWEILSNMMEAPYGLGPYALSLFTAIAFRHFGDELRLKINPAVYGYSPIEDPEVIIDVAIGRFPAATIERRVLTPATEQLINQIYNLFAESPAAAGTQQTLSEAWRALLGWWKTRTRLERAVGIYADDNTASSLVDMLSRMSEDKAGSQLFLEEIKQIYGYSADAELGEANAQEIIDELKDDKEIVESLAKTIRTQLVRDLAAIFHPAGETYKHYSDAILAWYSNLHADQKQLNAEWQSAASRSILEAVPKLQDLEKLLLETIPSAPGFKIGKVDDWSYDQSPSYLNTFQDALETIEQSLPKVPAPIWSTSTDPGEEYLGAPMVKYHGSVQLAVQVPDGSHVVRVTVNEDPRASKQFSTVTKDGQWETEVTASCAYYLVTQNSQGDFSKVLRVNFTNLDDGYKLIHESAPKLDPGERQYRFRNPVDKQGLVVLLKDIINSLKDDNRISVGDIVAGFTEAVSEIMPQEDQD